MSFPDNFSKFRVRIRVEWMKKAHSVDLWLSFEVILRDEICLFQV